MAASTRASMSLGNCPLPCLLLVLTLCGCIQGGDNAYVCSDGARVDLPSRCPPLNTRTLSETAGGEPTQITQQNTGTTAFEGGLEGAKAVECSRGVNVSFTTKQGGITGDVCYYTNMSSDRCTGSSDCRMKKCMLPIATESDYAVNGLPEDFFPDSDPLAENVTGYCLKLIENGWGLYVEGGAARFGYWKVSTFKLS